MSQIEYRDRLRAKGILKTLGGAPVVPDTPRLEVKAPADSIQVVTNPQEPGNAPIEMADPFPVTPVPPVTPLPQPSRPIQRRRPGGAETPPQFPPNSEKTDDRGVQSGPASPGADGAGDAVSQ